jgi:NADPH:quinone reductase-like Zn-dependent oxidoreductase/pimeloyl-ACP methyl ester carboxylesterase
MQAIRLHGPGVAELRHETIETPSPRPGDVLVEVHAAAITRDELDWPLDRLPAVPSYELSGVVAAVAEGAEVSVGDEVYGLTPFDRDGVAAEYAAVPAPLLAPKPASLSHVESAVVPLPALSAWQGLFDHGRLAAGEKVLVHGAVGGVGQFATQLARWRGAHVIATASPDALDAARALGAHEVVDGRSGQFDDELGAVDLVFDTVGGDLLARGPALLAPGGRLVSVAAEPPGEGTYFVVEPNRQQLIEIAHLADDGDLRVAIDSTYALSDAAAAFERSLQSGKRGKVVIQIDGEHASAPSGATRQGATQPQDLAYPTNTGTLQVPGATLYYEVYGSGPVLLLIPGGPADAGVFADLAGFLADRYTVVAYDPRGNSRSVADGPPQHQQLDVHGDDAARLLAAVGSQPADVFGSSGGAQIGLNLAARHPQRVHTLVAHEPPAVGLLPDAAQQRAAMQAAVDTYRREGVDPGMQRFGEVVGIRGGRGPVSQHLAGRGEIAEPAPASGRIMGNLDFFLGHGAGPLSSYVPDIAALRAGPVRIVAGLGESSAGQLAHRCGVALAERLGSDPVSFPGDHSGFMSLPEAFAQALHTVLGP